MKVCRWDFSCDWNFAKEHRLSSFELARCSFHSCCLSSWAVESYVQLLLQYILMHRIAPLQCGYRHSTLDMVKWWWLTNLKYKAVPENLCFWFSTQKEVNQPCGVHRGNRYILHSAPKYIRMYIQVQSTEYSTYVSCGYWQVCVHIRIRTYCTNDQSKSTVMKVIRHTEYTYLTVEWLLSGDQAPKSPFLLQCNISLGMGSIVIHR